jgi:hypothetical protein
MSIKCLWPSPLCAFVTMTAMGRSLKSWAGSMQSECLGDIFHIPDAATTGDLATTAVGVKAVKLRMGVCFPRCPR